jgi:hypothetical protein
VFGQLLSHFVQVLDFVEHRGRLWARTTCQGASGVEEIAFESDGSRFYLRIEGNLFGRVRI